MTMPKAVVHPAGGGGPALVMIHGFGADRLSWTANAPMLTAHANVWTLDLPGHGSAGNYVGDAAPETLAAAVADALPALDAPAVVVGHSLGGAVALHLNRLRPDLVRHLVLIAPAGLGGPLDHAFLSAYPELDDPDTTRALLERLVARKRLIAPAMIGHVLTGLETPGRRAALTAIADRLKSLDPLPLPAHLPVDVVWGSADAINPPPADSSAFTSYLSLPDTGHMPHVEAAMKVNAAIRAALVAPG